METNTFTGTSKNGDVAEALQDAIQLAKEGLQSSLIRWRVDEISGKSGGFVDLNDLTVKIVATQASS
jgi:flavin-binding protein dodecin